MLHKTITYTNLDGKEVSEEYWFRITKEKMAKKAAIMGEGYFDTLSKLKDERDGQKIMDHFDDILSLAVGKREGELFVQTPEIERRFKYSGAYDALFWELLTSPDSGAEQIASMYTGLNKDDVMKEVAKLKAEVQGTDNVEELPNSGVISEVIDAEIVESPSPTTSTKKAESRKDEDPAWLTELRNPTAAELRKASKEDLQLLFKMRESGVITK